MSTPPTSDPRIQGDVPDTKLPKNEAANTRSVLPPTASYHPDGAAAALVLQAGARPLPEYELIRQLGVGGFGEVWQARGPGGFDVALKFIRLEARGSQFELRALDIMKTIRHPNLVGFFGVWQHDGWLIVAMELCDRSLHDRLQEAQQQQLPGVPIKELLKYMRQAAEGLDALNARGVQHRDVKPRNLMLVGNGVKVADFGLAKVLEQSQAVHSGSMTMAYAAPESFKGTLTAQSDQYSLAVTYYELRTGRLPFNGDAKAIMYAHLEKTPDLSSLPAEERPVLARALAKEPKERWKNCKAFVNELIKAHQGRKPEPLKPPPTPKPDDIFAQETIRAPGPLQPPPGDKTIRHPPPPPGTRWLWPVLTGLFLMVLVSCGALSVGMGLFSNAPSTSPGKPTSTDKHTTTTTGKIGRASRDKDKDGQDAPNNGNGGTKLPASLLVDLGDGVQMEFMLIPKGTFKMGSPPGEPERNPREKNFDAEKQHEVEITKPFYLAKYPVMQEQYQTLMKNNPSYFQADKVKNFDTKRFPVENVYWDDAQTFCRKMRENDKQGRNFRLPTEAEWEYACRATTTTPFYFGSKLNGKEANCNGNYPYGTTDNEPYKERTTKVGEYGENKWGLCDMHGNVWQWCEDYYGPYNADLKATDPLRSVKYSEERRVMRGGSWFNKALFCRAASRNVNAPDGAGGSWGFRVCVRLD